MVGSRSSEPNTGSGEDKLNLFLKVIKTVPLTVKTSETVRNVKRMLNDKEGIPECLPDFFFNGNRLKDHQQLVHCGIQQNSTLLVFVPLRLFIKLPSNQKTIEVKAWARDTIQNVKSLIVAKVGIGLHDFNLIHAGKLLEDDKSLVSLNIQGESTLHMVIAPREMLKISVRLPTGEVLMLEVKMLYKVGDVKTIVESIVGFPVNGLILTYDGMQLEDSQNLSLYDIAEGSVLEMMPKSVQVFVRKGCGRTVTVDLCPEDSVESLKEKIFLKLGIPTDVQRLVFEGKCLDGDRNLASYNIQRHSTLHLAMGVSSSYMKEIKLSEIGFWKSDPPGSTTVSALKILIAIRTNLPVKELMKDRKLLKDQLPISTYGINMNSVITIVCEACRHSGRHGF